MPKFIIKWNAGFGESYDCIEAVDLEEAVDLAHDAWNDETQSNADYDALPLTEETASQYGYEDELE